MEHIVKNWIKQAAADLDSAQYNAKGKKYDVAAFLCQQSVEKALKGLYLQEKKELWKTHDLVRLASLLEAPQGIIGICNELNPIYFEERYPDFSDTIPAEKFNKEEIDDFLEKAKEVLEWIKTKIRS